MKQVPLAPTVYHDIPVESKTMQSTNTIFLVRPSSFSFNTKTSISNTFQAPLSESKETIQQKVLSEFDEFANTLTAKGIQVHVFDDTEFPEKPDAIFPNNWISFHPDGTLILYPMLAPNRRPEKREDIVTFFKNNYSVQTLLDLTHYEKDNSFLEGTGSIVFDHVHKIAYATLSPRTHKALFLSVCDYLHYQPVCFHAFDKSEIPIYHTNVMMCIAKHFAVICLDSIADKSDRAMLVNQLKDSGHQIIDISFEQMNQFACNMLSLQTINDKEILVLSQSAFDSLNGTQKKEIEQFVELLPMSIPTIETIGGGSARCMIAEVFLQAKEK